MLTLIHKALKDKITVIANLPKGVTAGYGDIETIYRKKINCKGQTNIPIFGFSIARMSEWIDNASTPMVVRGYPDSVPGSLPESTITGLKLLPTTIEYSCYYLSDSMVSIQDFVGKYLFFNYKANANNLTVDDPELTEVKYNYQVIYDVACEMDKKGLEYDIGYQYICRFNLKVNGPIREMITMDEGAIVTKLEVKIYLDDLLAEVWTDG